MNSKFVPYDPISQFFHWVMGFLILIMFIIGYGRAYIPFAERDMAMNVHKSIGILIFVLCLGRIIWALIRRRLPEMGHNIFEKLAARGAHLVLYGFMLAAPLSGWCMVSAFGKPVSFFGIFDMPVLVEKERSFGVFLKLIHQDLVLMMAGVIIVHALAALYHHVIRKDDVLKRMICSKKDIFR